MKPCYVFAFSLCLTSALSAETKPTYNMYGTLGMIDMPSAEMTSDVAGHQRRIFQMPNVRTNWDRSFDFVVANPQPKSLIGQRQSGSDVYRLRTSDFMRYIQQHIIYALYPTIKNTAVALGYNPDAPDTLAKVTVTV